MTEPVPGPVAVGLAGGGGFAVGGLSQLLFLDVTDETFSGIMVALLVPVVLRAVVGCGAVAWLLRTHHPAGIVWLTGVAAFALGSAGLIAALGGFVYTIYPLMGIGVGTLYGLLLRAPNGGRRLALALGMGYAVALIAMSLAFSLVPSDGGSSGDPLASALPLLIGDFVVGASTGVGLLWVLGPRRAVVPPTSSGS